MSVRDASDFKKYITEYFDKYGIQIKFTDHTTDGGTHIKFNIPECVKNGAVTTTILTYKIPQDINHACKLNFLKKGERGGSYDRTIETFEKLNLYLNEEMDNFPIDDYLSVQLLVDTYFKKYGWYVNSRYGTAAYNSYLKYEVPKYCLKDKRHGYKMDFVFPRTRDGKGISVTWTSDDTRTKQLKTFNDVISFLNKYLILS